MGRSPSLWHSAFGVVSGAGWTEREGWGKERSKETLADAHDVAASATNSGVHGARNCFLHWTIYSLPRCDAMGKPNQIWLKLVRTG